MTSTARATTDIAPVPMRPPTRWERLRARVARLEDRDGESGSFRLIVVRRTLLIASTTSALAWLATGIGLIFLPSFRQTIVSRPTEVLPLLAGVLAPLPIFLGLRRRKRVALVAMLLWAAGLAILDATDRRWGSALGQLLLFLLIASCWREVDQ